MQKNGPSAVRTFSLNNGLVEERRGQIIQATLHLMSSRGFQKTGIREIAKASDMTVGNLYHYIGAREDIIRLAFDYGLDQARSLIKEIDELSEALEPSGALMSAIGLYVRYQQVNRESTNFLYKEMGSLAPSLRLPVVEVNAAMHDAFIRILQKGAKREVFRTSNSGLVASTIIAMGDMWALKRWQFKKEYTLDKYIVSLSSIIMAMVSNAPGGRADSPAPGAGPRAPGGG